VYPGVKPATDGPVQPNATPDEAQRERWASAFVPTGHAPGICVSWDEKRDELPAIVGDPEIVKRVWENIEGFAYTYIWHCLVSF
jgi:hypothetical protein